MKPDPMPFRDSEFRLIQKLDRLEAHLFKIKRSLLKAFLGLAVILISLEGVHMLIH